jgi:hypothetical protein
MDQLNPLAVIQKYLCLFYEAKLPQAKKKKHRRINPQFALKSSLLWHNDFTVQQEQLGRGFSLI